jgi:hypothetical protein
MFMRWENPRLAFPNANSYAFLFENAHLLLMSWDRDDAKFLFLIREHQSDGLVLDYPGAAFTNRVMDVIERIFFVRLEEEGSEPKQYVLGSYFLVGNQAYGAYYEKDSPRSDVVLLRVVGEPPDLELAVVEDDVEHQQVASAFAEQHADFLSIAAVNQTNATENA